jgi:hypothetical protein
MSETILTYGSNIVHEHGLFVSLHDRHGSQWIEAHWNENRLKHAILRLPHGGTVQIRPEIREHALLGLCDGVVVDGRLRTLFSAVDWADPKCIPAMDAPGRLPSGAGSAILNSPGGAFDITVLIPRLRFLTRLPRHFEFKGRRNMRFRFLPPTSKRSPLPGSSRRFP